MDNSKMMVITKEQRLALKQLFDRSSQGLTYKQFRKTVQPLINGNWTIMVPWCGMFVGIEVDGYSHT